MTRLFNSLVALLLSCGCAAAGWNGFPLSGNTNYPTWNAVQASGINPLGQIFSAIQERYLAVYGTSVVPLITSSIIIDNGWETNVVYDLFTDHTITNVYPVTTTITVTNTFDPVVIDGRTNYIPVTRSTLSALWGFIEDIQLDFVWTGASSNAASYLASDPAWYQAPYTNSDSMQVRKLPFIEQVTIGKALEEDAPGFGWLTWEWVTFFGGSRWDVSYSFVEGGFFEAQTDTLMARSRVGTNGWSTVMSNNAPSYVPEWFVLGDTNAPRLRWEYTGTGTPPTAITITGMVYSASFDSITNHPYPADLSGRIPVQSMISRITVFRSYDYYVPTNTLLFTGMVESPGEETVGYGQFSTNLWKSVTVTDIDGGSGVDGDLLSVKWALHHLTPYRLYAHELDRMQKALNAMTISQPELSDWIAVVKDYDWSTNTASWVLSSTVTGTPLTVDMPGGGLENDVATNLYGSYISAILTAPAASSSLSTSVTYTTHVGIGYYRSDVVPGVFVFTNGVWQLTDFEQWQVDDYWDPGAPTYLPYIPHIVESVSERSGSSGTAVVEIDHAPAEDKFWHSDTWWILNEWDFEYK